jgi:hypothetical protein
MVYLSLTYALLRWGGDAVRAVRPALLLAAAFLPGLMLAASDLVGNDYAQRKTVMLFLYVLPGAMVASIWGRRRDFRIALIAVTALLSLRVFANGVQVLEPEYAGSGPAMSIAWGRTLGLLLLVMLSVAIALWDRFPAKTAVPLSAAFLLMAWFMIAALATNQNRGSLLGASLAAAVLLLLTDRGRTRVLMASLFALAGVLFMTLWFEGSRAQSLFSASGDLSAQTRENLWHWAYPQIWVRPLGMGWGGTGEYLPANLSLNQGSGQYVHNFLLETFLEGGWIAGIALTSVIVLFFARGIRLLRTSGVDFTTGTIYVMAIFLGFSALASADLTGNAGFLMFLFAGLSAAKYELSDAETNAESASSESTPYSQAMLSSTARTLGSRR